MDTRTLEKLNDKLRQAFGSNQYGMPNVKWAWSRDLKSAFFSHYEEKQLDSGIWSMASVHELAEQLPGEPRWVLAELIAPPSEAAWYESVGNEMEYPAKGYYICSEVACKVGLEPNMDLTDSVIHNFMQNRAKTRDQHVDAAFDASKKRRVTWETMVSDYVHDATPAFSHVPGAKDKVSFGGI